MSTGSRTLREPDLAKRRQDSFRELNDVPGGDVLRFQISKHAALTALGEVVYAIRCDDVIKVGHTTNLGARCYKLGSDDILGFMPGTLDDEQALHQRLAPHLARGREWYHPAPEVLAVVNDMRAVIGLEPVA